MARSSCWTGRSRRRARSASAGRARSTPSAARRRTIRVATIASARSTPAIPPRSVQEVDMRLATTTLTCSALAIALASPATGSPTAPTCPQTSAPTSWTGTTLDTTTTKNGTTYNPTGSDLELNHAGSVFNTKQMTTTSTMVYAAVGDFNKDGWPDFVGASENSSTGYLDVFQNDTWQNENCTTAACTAYSGAAPDWSDPTVVVTPKFTDVRSLHTTGFSGRYALAAGDFNGDGWDDVLEIQAPASGYQLTTVNLYINRAANDSQDHPTFNA